MLRVSPGTRNSENRQRLEIEVRYLARAPNIQWGQGGSKISLFAFLSLIGMLKGNTSLVKRTMWVRVPHPLLICLRSVKVAQRSFKPQSSSSSLGGGTFLLFDSVVVSAFLALNEKV